MSCSIDRRPDVEAINKALLGPDPSTRRIAARFGAPESTLRRHRDHCLAPPLPAIVPIVNVVDAEKGRTVRAELGHLFTRVHKLFDACDEWLRDPNDPGRYSLGPRAAEVKVIYTEWVDAGDRQIPVHKSDTLSRLLEKIEGKGLEVERLESKHADPRQLVLNTAAQLTRQIELLAKLTGELNERPEVNILVHPDWLGLREVILDALQRHPAARVEVMDAISQLSG